MKLLVSAGIPLLSHLHLICEGMAFGIPLVGRSIIASEMKVVAEAEGIQPLEGRLASTGRGSTVEVRHRAVDPAKAVAAPGHFLGHFVDQLLRRRVSSPLKAAK